MKTNLGMAIGIAAVSLLVGCGSSVPPPNDQYAAAASDLGRAQAGGAPAVPDARLHLQLAAEDLQKSKQAMGSDNARATILVAVADSEAQLALALARQADARRQADGAEAELQKAGGH
ncbi:MAG: DUF4398 domain-containing protein [Polyangiaceae bacterium]